MFVAVVAAGSFSAASRQLRMPLPTVSRKVAEIEAHLKAKLLVRLHCDANAGSGSAVYYPDRQGKVGKKVGPTKAVLASSKKAAQLFYRGYSDSLEGLLPVRGLHTDRATYIGGKQGALTGCIYSQVPVLLVEMAVLTNPDDEEFLANRDGFNVLAEALRAGVHSAVPL